MDMDEDALMAAVELVGRAGAKQLEIGYLHEDKPVHLADWYAHAQYRGARIFVEHHAGPQQAVEALAKRLLEGGICQFCKGLVGLSGEGVRIQPGVRMLDGSVMTAERAEAMHQCHWTRIGKRWMPGCTPPEQVPANPPPKMVRRPKKGKR